MKKLRLVLWLPLAGFLIFLIVFSIGLDQPEQKTIPSALVGQPMPDFALAPALPDRPGLSSADLRRGQPRRASSSSCGASCRQGMPQLAKMLTRRGIPIDGIAVRDRPEDLTRFLGAYGDPFRSIGADVDRRVQLNLGSAGVPETFIVDGRGVIRHQHIGPINAGDMPALLAAWQEASR